MKRIGMVAAALLLLAACEEGGGGTTAPTAKATAASTATAATTGETKTASTADTALDDADIPVEEDFEEEAEKAINDDNLDDEVSKLEKEISEDK